VTFAEIFAGIQGASVAWDALGWECRWVAETDAFASAVGAYHHDAPNLGDVHEIRRETAEPVDILIGGPPCQDFSVAGKREGMAGGRGSLVWQYLRVADELRPRWLVFENVPGLLSSGSGRDFGAFLGALAERGYMGCYRVLDAQYFGLPQRRRRVFAVCHIGDWRPAAAVLLERESLCWNPAPSRETGEAVAGSLGARASAGGGLGTDFECGGGLVTGLRARTPGTGSRVDEEMGQLIAFSCKDNGRDVGEVSPPLRAMGHDQSHPNAGGQVAVAFNHQSGGDFRPMVSEDMANPLQRSQGQAIVFDTRQITSKANRTRVEEGLPASSLAARSRMHVAFAVNAKGGSGGMDGESETFVPLTSEPDTCNMQGIRHGGKTSANAEEARPREILSALWRAIGEEAMASWCFGILASLQSAEVLQYEVLGSVLRPAPFSRSWVVYCALSREEGKAEGAMQSVREACLGRSSQGRELSQQLARELGAYLSLLSQPPSPRTRFLHDMWEASEGSRLLRQALSAVQEMGGPVDGEGQSVCPPAPRGSTESEEGMCREGMCLPAPRERVLRDARAAGSARPSSGVRRITPIEAEFLQGFPPQYTLIPWRGKPREQCPDGPRYRVLGNAFPVPVVRWIGERIAMVEATQ